MSSNRVETYRCTSSGYDGFWTLYNDSYGYGSVDSVTVINRVTDDIEVIDIEFFIDNFEVTEYKLPDSLKLVQERLKPCPWCGSVPSIYDGTYFTVICENNSCNVNVEVKTFTKERAVEVWNTRKEN